MSLHLIPLTLCLLLCILFISVVYGGFIHPCIHPSVQRTINKSNDRYSFRELVNRTATTAATVAEATTAATVAEATTTVKTTNKRGIVIVAGAHVYFTNAYVLVARLRNELKCTLPIEIWHRDNETSLMEMRVWKTQFSNVSYRCLETEFGGEIPGKYTVKPVALKVSAFDEILLLDADNNCIRDPSVLFNHPTYIEYGSVFWPDFWPNSPDAFCYAFVNHKENIPLFTQESGQILIDRRRCAKALELCVQINIEYWDRLDQVLIPGAGCGDKDSYQVAWLITNTPFYMIPYRTAGAGYITTDEEKKYQGTTMVQHDFDGEPIFFHKNWVKWDSQKEPEMWQVYKYFKRQNDTENDRVENTSWDFVGPSVCVENFKERFGIEFERSCWKHLQTLKQK